MTIVNESVAQLDDIAKKLDGLLKGQKKVIDLLSKIADNKPKSRKMEEELESQSLDVVTLLSLPDNIRKTALALSKLGEATADKVAKETERTRAIESAYLNQLQRMGYINRKRKGHTVVYSPIQ
jgi:hypothetical protein